MHTPRVFLLLILLLASCTQPTDLPPTATQVPSATVQPTRVPPTATPAPTTALPATATALPTTKVPAATAPASPTPAATSPNQTLIVPTLRSPTAAVTASLPPAVAMPKGVLVYNRTQETITGYDFTGTPLRQQQYKLPGAGWLGDRTVQLVDNTVIYLKASEKALYRVSVGGTPQKLAFIPAKDSLQFLVSADGKKIAWSFMLPTSPNPSSELWVANLDGSAAKRIYQLEAAANPKMLSLKPLRWLADGRLLFVEEPNGIGGYILFSGFSGIRVYDLNQNRASDLTPKLGAGGLCLEEITPTLTALLSTCTGSDHSTLGYINLTDQKTLAITRQADQNQVGSPVFSASGSWLAYAYARGDPDNEQGWVAVAANGATMPKILGTVPKGYFNVKAWTNEVQLIVQRYDEVGSSLWLFSRDSGAPRKLADGDFVALIRN